jgi:hypothetical protein
VWVVVCFHTVCELPVFFSHTLFPERMLVKELRLQNLGVLNNVMFVN